MTHKKLFIGLTAILFSFLTMGKSNYIDSRAEGIKTAIVNRTKKAMVETLEDTEDPDEIFSRSIADYENEFSEYLNITALNVSNREAINLPNFDADYVAPEFNQVMYDYQVNLESTLSSDQLQNYEYLRKQNYTFDRYVTLNQTLYRDLNIDLKYTHDIRPTNPLEPITPLNPKINPISGTTNRVAAVATVGIASILAEAGLGEAVVAAFSSCVSTMTLGLSTSWIPFVGWALAVALVVGALIAIAVIIVENWGLICRKMDEIKAWFLEQFSKFATFIESFFGDAVAKGNESKISAVRKIGDKEFEFTEISANDDIAQIDITKQQRRKKDVLLMQFVKAESFQIALGVPVTKEFCVKWKTDYIGCSSYTWYQNTARSLILEAGTGYTTANPELHLLNKNIPGNDDPKYAFKHFHNCDASGKRVSKNPQHWTHSFFGLLDWTENDDGVGTTHPLSPKN